MPETVLVIDDSALMRKHLRQLLEAGGYHVQTARNGQEGLDKVEEIQPDVVTLDVNMPVMDGITCLSLIMAKNPMPVIMVSSITNKGAMATLEAMELGAVDYILKPGGTVSLNIREIERELLAKVESAVGANVGGREKRISSRNQGLSLKEKIIQRRNETDGLLPDKDPDLKAKGTAAVATAKGNKGETGERDFGVKPKAPELVIVGVSTGGPRTLEAVIQQLPKDFSLPILIAQHMPARFTKLFAERLDKLTPLTVVELTEPSKLTPGTIYIAQGDADIKVVRRVGHIMAVNIPVDKQFVWHPSVERLALSAVEVFDPAKIIFVQLTGMGNDGAKTMTQAFKQGARTVAESEETAVVFGMPKELIRLGGAEIILPNDEIADTLVSWAKEYA